MERQQQPNDMTVWKYQQAAHLQGCIVDYCSRITYMTSSADRDDIAFEMLNEWVEKNWMPLEVLYEVFSMWSRIYNANTGMYQQVVEDYADPELNVEEIRQQLEELYDEG